MSSPLSPAELKEVLVEWGMRSWSTGLLIQGISPANITNMSLLDASAFEQTSDATPYHYEGIDLHTALNRIVKDADRESFLKSLFMPVMKPGNEHKREQVERLLDEELQRYELPPLSGKEISLGTKAAAIAGYRMKKDIIQLKTPESFSRDKKKYEFAVHLTIFIGRHGGSPRLTKLYFNYSTKLHYFLKILQDETQLCKSPLNELPDPQKLQSCRQDSFIGQSETLKYRSLDGRVPTRSGIQSLDNFDNSSTISSGLASIPEAPKNDPFPRGYTLDDGPWLYRIAVGNKVKNKPYIEITDETTYRKMLDALKEASEKERKDECSAILIHAMEREIQKTWETKIEQEKADEARIKESFDSMLDWGYVAEEELWGDLKS